MKSQQTPTPTPFTSEYCEHHKMEDQCSPQWKLVVFTGCSPALSPEKRCDDCKDKTTEQLQKNFGTKIVWSCRPFVPYYHLNEKEVMINDIPRKITVEQQMPTKHYEILTQ